jgi:ZIP family zinc transporter
MSDFALVLVIASAMAAPLYLAGVLAEKVDVPHRAVSAALQLAAGVLTAIVAFTLMPPAVQSGPPLFVLLAFVAGGAIVAVMELLAARRQASKPATDARPHSLGLVLGVLVDMAIDGVAIGIGSTLTLGTGLLLGVGLAVSTAPLAFVTIANAKHQGMQPERRRRLSLLFVVVVLAGATLGYWGLRDQSQAVKLVLIALVAGFLITIIAQSIIPEANREAETGDAALSYVAGLALFALLALAVK